MNRPVRVLHIGDLHLGVERYGRPDPEKGYGTRVGDFLAALDRALEHAEGVDLVLFPGDIYRNCDPTPTLQREFGSRVRALSRRKPVAILPGNHDLPSAVGRASSVDIFQVLEVDNVHVLRDPEVRVVQTDAGPVLLAALPFLSRSRMVATEDARGKTATEVEEMLRVRLIRFIEHLLVPRVEEERQRVGPNAPAILMAHYTVQGAEYGGYGRGGMLAQEVQLPLSVVRNPAFDYVALGHIHKHQTVPLGDLTGQPPVVYPGSIERVDFGEEEEEKVVVLAEVERGRAVWRAVSVNARPFVTLRIEADGADPLASVREQLERAAERIQGAVVRVFYTLPAGHPNLPERELRRCLEGAAFVAGIRRETPEAGARSRAESLNTQLGPLEALEEYLHLHPELAARREALLERARSLVNEVAAQVEATRG